MYTASLPSSRRLGNLPESVSQHLPIVFTRGCVGVVHRDGHYFPIKLTLVNHGQTAKGFTFKNLSNRSLSLTDLDNIHCHDQRVNTLVLAKELGSGDFINLVSFSCHSIFL